MKLRVASGVVRGASLVLVMGLRAHRALRRGSRFIVMVDVCVVCGKSRAGLDCLLLLEDED